MRCTVLAGLAYLAFTSALPSRRQDGWPYAPFTTSGRDIVNSRGDVVTYAGVNWPGAGETMLPEGLQYQVRKGTMPFLAHETNITSQSVESIVSKVKSLGMNVIRLTYAIEMIDDIYDDSPNQSLQATLANGLGSENGSTVLQQILANNPQFTESTTRLEVFDAVAAECATQQIYVHLDNHMSKAEWCCSVGDGNAWYVDRRPEATP